MLSVNTIGEMWSEFFYLRLETLRGPLFLGMSALLLQLLIFIYEFLAKANVLVNVPTAVLYVNAIQSVAFAVAAFMVYVTIRRYTPRGIESRIGQNMTAIAQMGSQRRRRRERTERVAERSARADRTDGGRGGGRERTVERSERSRDRDRLERERELP
ncbi:MAG: hypothetical protein ACYDDF_14005 [Thermoplasmatota archaeon]